MKVQPNVSKNSDPAKKAMSQDDVKAKIMAKFGKDLTKKPKATVDKVELSSKKGVTNSDEENFGDIGKNIPDSAVTQERLKSILKNGGFQFNEKERQALSTILK